MERVPCSPDPNCKYFERGCFEDLDHHYWPAKDYTTPVEKEFRELPENKSMKCRVIHEQRHATEQPPLKPSRDFMLNAINTAVEIRRAS